MDRAFKRNRKPFGLRPGWLGVLTAAAVLLAACTSAAPANAPTTVSAPASAPTAGVGATSAAKPAASAAAIELSFFYPVAVGGPVTKIIEGYADEFNKANSGIHVTATFSGSYQDSLTKSRQQWKAVARRRTPLSCSPPTCTR